MGDVGPEPSRIQFHASKEILSASKHRDLPGGNVQSADATAAEFADVQVSRPVDRDESRGLNRRRCCKAAVTGKSWNADSGDSIDHPTGVNDADTIVEVIGNIEIPHAINSDALRAVELRTFVALWPSPKSFAPGPIPATVEMT